MNKQREALLRKVRAMLAMAQGTTNTEEAFAFLNKAQAWLVEHNISEAELSSADHEFVIHDAPAATDWEQRINLAVARLYFCRYFVVRIREQNVHSFCGEEHNVRVAQSMADYILGFVRKAVLPGAKARAGEEARLYEISFLHQSSVTVADRIRRRILASLRGHATSNGTTLPALMDAYTQSQQQIDDFLKQQFGVGAGQALSVERHDPQGLEDGDAAGNAVGLDTQVGGSPERKQIR